MLGKSPEYKLRQDELKDAKKITSSGNMKIMEHLVKDWHLGPQVGIDNNQGNDKFWSTLAEVWSIPLVEARRRSCANCEYGHISPDFLKAMEHVPYNKFDNNGGMRVWCTKFDFICHATRVCQNWEQDND